LGVGFDPASNRPPWIYSGPHRRRVLEQSLD
jgi:hypothetical protein